MNLKSDLILHLSFPGAGKRREIGSKGVFMEKLMQFQRQGKEKAEKNTQKESGKTKSKGVFFFPFK